MIELTDTEKETQCGKMVSAMWAPDTFVAILIAEPQPDGSHTLHLVANGVDREDILGSCVSILINYAEGLGQHKFIKPEKDN